MADKYNASRNQTRKERIAKGLCRDCGQVPFEIGKVICQSCFDKRANRQSRRKAILSEQGKCLRCSAYTDRTTSLCQSCMDKQILEMRDRRRKNKELVVEYFGGKCKQCGESNIVCLTVDHVDNNGNIDCKSSTGKRIISPQWYAKLVVTIKAGWPLSGLQLLCFNCHAKKDLQPWWLKEIENV